MDTTDQPNSICHIQPIQMYPLNSHAESDKPVPFVLLAGEEQHHHGVSVDGLIVITNYRLFLQTGSNQYHVPLGLIEVVENRELFYLQIGCKDARTYRCTFENNESCLEWYDRIVKAAEPPRQLDQLFAFYHFMWTKETAGAELTNRIERQRMYSFDKTMFDSEMTRMEFGFSWRISKANQNYKLCPTYPPYLLVPSCITDETLESVAKFRSSRRIPAVVWRHTKNGAVIARCSQPEVGWLGWRSGEDEDLIKAISDACSFEVEKALSDRDEMSHSPESIHSDSDTLQITNNIPTQTKKVLIMDARSYTTAVANRARGGGCECPEYYPNCEIQFMNLANIHSIRKSFHALRQLCTSSADQPNWFSQLENTRWLLHMSGLMKAAVTLVNAVERDARPVLVHCSDGWDRTPQIVALAELLLDPYYRTMEGFRTLIEREWLAFGHKFADRCGHSTGSEDQNERCPVFLQWLDCVHQLLGQYPCDFEFSQTYLVKLAQHTYSNLFGTFLCNTQQERANIYGKTFSAWDFLSSSCFKNHLYASEGSPCFKKVLWPQCNVRDLTLWNEMYLGSMEANASSQENGSGSCPGPPDTPHHMTKTRSYGDLLNAGEHPTLYTRRNSDPNINCDSKLSAIGQDIPNAPTQPSLPAQQQQTDAKAVTTNGNGRLRLPGEDFLDSGSEGGGPEDCTTADCMYKNGRDPGLTDDQIDGLDRSDFEPDEVESICPTAIKTKTTLNGSLASLHIYGGGGGVLHDDTHVISEKTEPAAANAATFTDTRVETSSNGAVTPPLLDAEEPDERSESKSECTTVVTMCDGSGVSVTPATPTARFENSVETSTETLVSEQVAPGSSPREINGFEKIQSPNECVEPDGCHICSQNMRADHRSHHFSGDTSQYSTPKIFSRTTSCNGWDSLSHQRASYPYQFALSVDGLVPLRSPIQERLDQIIEDQKRKEDLLQKELHTYRQQRIKAVCHKCTNGMDPERQDDNSTLDRVSSTSSSSSRSVSDNDMPTTKCGQVAAPRSHRGSVIESVGSVCEGQASAVESLRSDMSWEAVEDSSLLEGHAQTLWVPDHAVTSCTACKVEFWMGRRKHHCRKCGRIFCADCSVHSTPLPSEQLYNPVRVCTLCYSKLHRNHDDQAKPLYEDKCKQHPTQTTNSNPQIAASSN